ncbi:MAG TPA: hypothetical protein PK264_15790 [Hyphomicrobiaceae bacterium]|nr:hypothetical protein [Hyphomicrobiaceae bacterium]
MQRVIELAQRTIDGALLGAGYTLVAVSLAQLFAVTRRLNLAFGSLALAGVALGIFVAHRAALGAGYRHIAGWAALVAALAPIPRGRVCEGALSDAGRPA